MKAKISVGLLLLGVGHISGQHLQSRVMKKRLIKILPLIQNSLSDVIAKGIDEDMSKEELKEALDSELRFITIAMKTGA